jgi:HD domain-containing protein
MVRMSDLVRGVVRERPATPAPAAPPEGARPVAPPRPRASVDAAPAVVAPPAPAPEPTPVPEPRPAPGPTSAPAPRAAEPAPAPPKAPTESVEALFADLLAFTEQVRDIVRTGEALPWATLESLVSRCIRSLRESADLFWLANNPVAPPGVDYLAFHHARVCVLALRIGAATGYDAPRLLGLGMAACLIDAALWQFPEPVLRRIDSLTGEEATLYRAHPRLSSDIVRRWGGRGDQLAAAVLQHHEREHGQGFPQALEGDAIDRDAKILGLVDTYASLTVPLTSRPRLRAHEAIRDIVKTRHDAFPSSLIKALLSEVSVFPPGTVVRLNTEEVGRVIAVNRNHPLRPRVEIVADSKGHSLAAAKIIDLSEAPFLYITGPVTETTR